MTPEAPVTPAPAEVALEIARTVALPAADAVDAAASFPAASIAALAGADLLSPVLPLRLGGAGLDTGTISDIARSLARGCGATAMIWAMHQVQLACVARHAEGADLLEGLVADCARNGGLVASVTSEQGVGGNLRESRACCELDPAGATATVVKAATTVSYGLQAAAFLVTARRDPDAPAGEQIAVFATREQTRLEDVGDWNVMGMRGTCSPGCRVTLEVDAAQVLPVPFGQIASATMVPLSHILWSSVWIGIAEAALARATRYLRAKRQAGGPHKTDVRLVAASVAMSQLDGLLRTVIDRYEAADGDSPDLLSTDFSIELNNLKLAASTRTVEVVIQALEICGIAGYQTDGPFAMSRLLRDLLSARLMTANARLEETNGASLLMRRYD